MRGLCAAGFEAANGSLFNAAKLLMSMTFAAVAVDAGDGVRGIGVGSQAAAGISGCEEDFTAVEGSGALSVRASVASREESARGAGGTSTGPAA